MKDMLKEKVDLMINNYYDLKNSSMWESNLTKHFSAMVHSTKGERVNIEKLEEIKRFIKDNTSSISYFRGTNIFILGSLLAFEEDYRGFFTNLMEVYTKLKAEGFKSSPFLPLTAYTVVKEVSRDKWENKIIRMRKFYDNMKKNHYWITSHDDYVFTAVLGISDLEIESTIENTEQCYNFLHGEGFWKGNNLQTLSHVLAIGEEEVSVKCKKASDLYQKLKEADCKLQYNGLAALGVLTLVSQEVNDIVRDVREVYDYLYSKSGYGFWSLGSPMRSILATSLVSDYYVEEIKKGVVKVALGNSINAIIIAQQQAAVAAACAASASATAGTSS